MSAPHHVKVQVKKVSGSPIDISKINSHLCVSIMFTHHSKELGKSVRRPRLRTRTSQKSVRASSSDDEPDITNNVMSKYKKTKQRCLSIIDEEE